MRHHSGVAVVVAASTLWGLLTLSLTLPLLRAHPALSRTAAVLLAAELVMLLAWSYGRDSCADGACGPGPAVAHAGAFQDIPALALALVVVALLHGRHEWRRSGR